MLASPGPPGGALLMPKGPCLVLQRALEDGCGVSVTQTWFLIWARGTSRDKVGWEILPMLSGFHPGSAYFLNTLNTFKNKRGRLKAFLELESERSLCLEVDIPPPRVHFQEDFVPDARRRCSHGLASKWKRPV